MMIMDNEAPYVEELVVLKGVSQLVTCTFTVVTKMSSSRVKVSVGFNVRWL